MAIKHAMLKLIARISPNHVSITRRFQRVGPRVPGTLCRHGQLGENLGVRQFSGAQMLRCFWFQGWIGDLSLCRLC